MVNSLWTQTYALPRDLNLKMTYVFIKKYFNNLYKKVSLQKIIVKTHIKKQNIHPTIIGCFVLVFNQKPYLTIAKKANLYLKIKYKQLIGCKSTFRKQAMFSFLEKFTNIVLPRIKELPPEYKIKISKNVYNYFRTYLQNYYQISLLFPEFEHLEYLYNLSSIFYNLETTFIMSHTLKKETLLLLSAYQFPIDNYKEL